MYCIVACLHFSFLLYSISLLSSLFDCGFFLVYALVRIHTHGPFYSILFYSMLQISSGDHKVTLWKETLDRNWAQVTTLAEEGLSE